MDTNDTDITTVVDGAATRLLGLEGVGVVRVDHDQSGLPVAHLVTTDPTAAVCPGCGVASASRKARATTRPRHLPCGGQPVALVWHKTRWRCTNQACPRGSFTDSTPDVPPRHRISVPARVHAARRVVDHGSTVVQAARDNRMSWPVVWAAVHTQAAPVVEAAPRPVRVLGIDETRRGRPVWVRDPDTCRWAKVTDRWHVGMVDLTGGQGLLGQVEGRTADDVAYWLWRQPAVWRQQIGYVAIDLCTIFASAIRRMLPHATIVVDHFHLVQLANNVVTEVRQQATSTLRGRRGRTGDGEYDVRRLLMHNREDLSDKRFARLWNTLIDLGGAGDKILAAYIAKEQLRELLALVRQPDPHRIRQRLHQFYSWCADTDLPPLHRLAATVERWWPQILAFLDTGITNAGSEAVNRVVKLAARTAFGFRNPTNQRLRTRCVTTRKGRGHLMPA